MIRRAAAALVLAVAACAPSAPVLDAGAVRGGVYHNDYFRLSLPIPDGWTAETIPQADWVLDNLLSLLAASDTAITDEKEIPRRKRMLLRASSNLNFIQIGAAQMGDRTDIRLGADCLKRLPALLKAGGRPFRVAEAARPRPVGGLAFDSTAFSIRLEDGEVHERVYAVVRWGYALVIVAGSSSPAGLKKAEAVAEQVLYTPKA